MDVERERTQAWTRLLQEQSTAERPQSSPAAPGPRAGRDAARGRLRESVVDTRVVCQEARGEISTLLRVLDTTPRDAVSASIVREWVKCIDEVLAIADRACHVMLTDPVGANPRPAAS